MLSPRRLAEIMADLAAIDHVKIIRIHTRVPVADPARISPEMVAALKVRGRNDSGWCTPIIHGNFPIGARCLRASGDAGIPPVSQSVLLCGVNDDAATLEALMRTFVETGSSRTTCITAIWRRARRICAPRSSTARN
jgi:lysine 2,3-aminomutase